MTENESRTPEFDKDGAVWWEYRYDTGDTCWYRTEPHPMLKKHYDKLNPGNKAKNILVPLCGKSVDLEWFLSKGIPAVVGVDFVLKVLREVRARSGEEWTESAVADLGPDALRLARSDGKLVLYSADMLTFSPKLEGTFDAMWDRGAIQILPPRDVERYVQVLKSLLAPGGRLLLEAIEFDTRTLDPARDERKPFPPFPMFLDDIKRLFGPECTVEPVETIPTPFPTFGSYTNLALHLIVKK